MNTVLILEDEAPIRTLVKLTLAPLGYTVLQAATAEEALRHFMDADACLDLLIADVNLPGGRSGVRVASELRSLLPCLRIILISGVPPSYWDEQDAAEWSEIPSDSVVTLQKPFHAAELLQSVNSLVRDSMLLRRALSERNW